MSDPSKDINKEDIKARIRKTGETLRSLSLKWGYTGNAISVALNKPWSNVEARIAKYLGCTPQSIWPSRYDHNGNPNHLNNPKTTQGNPKCHRQKRGTV